MRKLIIAIVVVCLVAAATPVMAQGGDPLALAAIGVLLPFFNTNGDISVIEASAPLGGTPGHLVFFDETCARSESLGLSLTENDVTLRPTNGTAPNKRGLITYSGGSGPLSNPVHTRVYWFNAATGRARVLEPITILLYGGTQTWNPLRTGATFFAPLEGGLLRTTLYLICPKSTIHGDPTSELPPGPFPQIIPPFGSDYTGGLSGRVYDTDEHLLADITFSCDCLVERSVASISAVYSDASQAPSGTYTEIQSSPAFSHPSFPGQGFAFTGYKSLSATGIPFDFFGRLSNNSRTDAGGSGPTTNNR